MRTPILTPIALLLVAAQLMSPLGWKSALLPFECNVLMEAQSQGLACVATRVSAKPDGSVAACVTLRNSANGAASKKLRRSLTADIRTP